MEQCRLGYNDLHVAPLPPQNLPAEFVMVDYTCPCGEYTTRFALHRILLYHLMGSTERTACGPRIRPYLRMLTDLQSDAMPADSRMGIDEESADR